CGGRRCRRTQHGVYAVLPGFIDGPFQPSKLIIALGGFHFAPGKLADAHEANAGLLHQMQIGRPARLRPLFWIPGGAKQNGRRWRYFGHFGGGLREGRFWNQASHGNEKTGGNSSEAFSIFKHGSLGGGFRGNETNGFYLVAHDRRIDRKKSSRRKL